MASFIRSLSSLFKRTGSKTKTDDAAGESSEGESAEAGSKTVEAPTDVQRPALASHDSAVLDLAFAMDCTASMSSYIKNAQKNIRTIVEEIVSSEKSDVKLALVQYRDHPPQDSSFVTKVLDFTSSVSKMKRELDSCSAQGGGDGPEAVADALHQVVKLSWRPEATKICVLISDAPPHGLRKNGDGFPKGCPVGLDPVATTRQLAERGVTLYVVGCEPAICPYKDFFSALAHMTGGQYVRLGKASLLAKVIIGGAQEEITLEKLMEDVNEELKQEAMAAGEEGLSEDEMTTRVFTKMKTEGVRAKQLFRKKAALPQANARAKAYAGMNGLDDVGKAWREDNEKVDSGSRSFRPGVNSRRKKKCSSKDSESSDSGEVIGAAAALSFDEGLSSGSEEFETREEEVSEVQVNRMIQKSMARQGIKKRAK